ncbi:hypothetical protein I6E29_00350 [Arcanobacterium haemolyticum]|nr:hypothetical protein [Arcanobacterium haemolyticum]
MKKFIATLTVVVATILTPTAQATEAGLLTDTEERQIISIRESRGTDPEIARELVERMDNGYLTEADRGDSAPIETRILDNGNTVNFYSDGSSSLVSVGEEDTFTRATRLDRCGHRRSTGYYASYIDCRVTYDAVALKYSFASSFSYSSAGGTISSTYSPVIERAFGVTASDVSVAIVPARSGAQPALAQMTFLSTKSIAGHTIETKTRGLSLRVYANKYTIGG